jgi:AdoMet-dependent heme synthase
VSAASPAGRFDRRPLLVFWETTRACGLACAHCRASATTEPGPDELTTAEGLALIEELGTLGSPRPILVLTGGDCLQRDDLVELAAHARRRQIPVAIAPSVTSRLTSTRLQSLRRQGVKTASLSLDGASPVTHDAIRGIDGHFDETLQAIGKLQRNGFTVQINTTVMRRNVEELADVASLMHDADIDAWEVFFLVTTGRGTAVEATTPEENEAVCRFLVEASRYGFAVRTVEAPFFRRVALECQRGDDGPRCDDALATRLRDRLVDRLGTTDAPVRAPSAATRDGKGIVFVASNGDVYPSGFLPIRLGNVRREGLVGIYRDDPLLRSIRAAEFDGRCARCDYADLCGGSRSRAYALTGDPLGEDPGCVNTAAALATI